MVVCWTNVFRKRFATKLLFRRRMPEPLRQPQSHQAINAVPKHIVSARSLRWYRATLFTLVTESQSCGFEASPDSLSLPTEIRDMKQITIPNAMSFLIVLLTASVSLSPATWAQTVITSSVTPVTGGNHYCAKCGKFHASSTTIASAFVQQSTYTSPSATMTPSIVLGHSTSLAPSTNSVHFATPGRGGVQNVLSTLNAQRARSGVNSLQYDPTLQAVAEQRAQLMASMNLKSHPPGSFAPGTYEGVGWSSSYSPSGVSACFTNDSRMRAAGAAMATGSDGVYFAVVYR